MDVIDISSRDEKIHIGNRLIGGSEPVFIIAEAGINHNGDVNLAKLLIDEAARVGADAVKFQTFHADNIVSRIAAKADYQKSTTSPDESQYDMIKKLELPNEAFHELSDYAKKRNILFLSTPFDEESVDLLEQIGVPAYKISSGEITNYALLKKIAEMQKPVILSTGMATLEEVKAAVSILKTGGAENIILLHCTTSYPAPMNSVNLRAMETLRSAFHVLVGYSDHTSGILISIAAAAMGASVLEKHFTLDKSLPGPDHKASLEPHELQAMISAVRDVETALGNGIKEPQNEEVPIKKVARRSIVAKCDINAGEVLKESDLAIKRPGTGIDPKYRDLLIHKKVKTKIQKDQVFDWDMIE